MTVIIFLKLIRWQNLLIIALTQCLLEFSILSPRLAASGISSNLDGIHFVLLVLVTALIAAAGYVVNDIVDVEIDLINKPRDTIVGKYINIRQSWLIYGIITLTGLLMALKIALYIQNLILLLIYPLAIGGITAYSYHFKKRAVWGNLAVSAYCAMVTGILMVAEAKSFNYLQSIQEDIYNELALVFWAYLIFSFLISLYREITKDIEDIEGDANQGVKSLPVLWGMKRSKMTALGLAVILLISIIYWLIFLWEGSATWHLLYFFILLTVPLIISMIILKKAKNQQDYHLASRWIKIEMLAGIVYLLVI